MSFQDGTMVYHGAGIAELSSHTISISQRVDQAGQEAINLVAGSPEYFQGPNGAEAYREVMHLIGQAIAECHQVLHTMSHTDTMNGANFRSV
jgi:hypothetical protein